MGTRYFVPVGTVEYAKLHGISARAARRRIANLPGAVKSTGNRWVAPIPATTYARLKGVSPKAARRQGTAAQSPVAATSGLQGTLRARAEAAYLALLGTGPRKKPVNPNTIHARMGHAFRAQLPKVLALTTIPNVNDDEWLGDDSKSILFYH